MPQSQIHSVRPVDSNTMAQIKSSTTSPFKDLIDQHRPNLAPYEDLYKHLHANPELSDQEAETASLIASRLKDLSSDIEIKTNIGGHGLFGIIKNGDGPTVLVRADFDALPLREKTGLEYASKKEMRDAEGLVRGVMHACGHDFHVTCLLAATETLISAKASWSGTLIALFQPAEERGTGARAMVKDGLYKEHGCPIPDVLLGQHVFPLRAGHVATKPGTIMSAADSFKITIHGSGGHGSMPHRCIDPVVIASHCVVKLQTIVSREVPPDETAVVTIGALQAGSTENVISDEAVLKLDIRSVTDEWRKRILESVKRIVKAECVAGKCPKEPTFERTRDFPLTINNEDVNAKISDSFDQYFGEKHQGNMPNALGSEDFGILGSSIDRPYCFWFWGGHDGQKLDEAEEQGRTNEIPVNHSPYFAPIIQPTLTTGVDAAVVGALTFLQTKD